MKGVFKFAVVLALAIAVVGAYGVFTSAKASAGSAASVFSHENGPLTVSAATTLKKERFASGFSGVTMVASDVPTLIDGTTLTCPGTSGTCTYTATNYLQTAASSGTSNWALATQVDGNYIGQGGPFLGPVGTDFAGGSWSDTGSGISFGSHSIQTYAFARDVNMTAFNYNFEYKVFKP